jgi:predicted KAP-like P-loop ATPase
MTSGSVPESMIAGDRPLNEDGTDLLGFSPLANQLAAALISGTTSEGLVIGIQGKWGSGKSSLVSLTTKALRDQGGDEAPSILVFRPWLIGNRDALLAALFSELADTVAKIKLSVGDATQSTLRGIDSTAESLRSYGRRLGSLAPIAQFADAVGVPYASWASKALKGIKEASKTPDSKPLSETKKIIDKAIKELPRKIVVFVDDLDRLEPSEIAEMLRLVRSVADFENVTYILCYDEDVLARAIQDTMKVVDGRAFMEKLVQVAVRIPAPEPFLLRKLLLNGLSKFANTRTEDEARRLNIVVDSVGPRMDTMRSVKRVLDAVRFAWPALDGRVDLGDYLWLQIIRATMPELFNWAEDYLSGMSVEATGRGGVTSEGKRLSYERLTKALTASSTDFESQSGILGEILPGMAYLVSSDPAKLPIYISQSPENVASASRDKRLASPDHQRLYFALAIPTGAVEERDYELFWKALDEGEGQASNVLSAFFDTGDQLVRKGEILISRLKSREDPLTSVRAARVLSVIAETMDHPQAIRDFDDVGGPPSWHEAQDWFRTCRTVLGEGAASPTLRAFHHGKAIGWLTSVFRSETFSHGIYGDQTQPENKRLMSREEYERVAKTMRDRYARMDNSEMFSVPSLPHLLYAWSQPDYTDEVRERVARLIISDEDFIRYLENISSEVVSTNGNYWKIPSSTLADFTDPDEVRSRLESLTLGESIFASQATELTKQVNNAKRW